MNEWCGWSSKSSRIPIIGRRVGPGGRGVLCNDENILERVKRREMVNAMNKKLSKSSMLFVTIRYIYICALLALFNFQINI